MFLVEIDTKMIRTPEEYKLEGFITILQKKDEQDENLRIIALIEEELSKNVKIREDLMSTEFPSIWIEVRKKNEKGILIGGFYREWTHKGNKSEEDQLRNIEILTEQIERATNENKELLLLGDANICTMKWNETKYKHHKIATEIKNTLTQCGMKNMDIGITYMADNKNKNGEVTESALDHIYIRKEMEPRMTVRKLEKSATDHLPIIAELRIKVEQQRTKTKKITKRSMKNFTKERWNICLANKKWEEIGYTEDVNKIAVCFNTQVTEALDECAPIKEFTVRQKNKFGLSEETKQMMKTRDGMRKSINQASAEEKKILHLKYKKTRNRVTNLIRQDNLKYSEERIENAKDENEIWKVVNEITKPREETTWKLIEDEKSIDKEEEIAEIFNKFFIDKIDKLKENIDQSYVKEPLEKLRKKMEKKNIKFSLKTVTEKSVKKAMQGMKKKKSAGKDGISQEQIILGTDVLVIPLTRMINTSIRNGEVPTAWKEAIVTPILKKGDPLKKENYRPVSCLIVASKVMEKVICNQVTRFFEKHGLLPDNQHGFRSKRSTMTALSSMQQDWTKNTDDKTKTGILLWDLSAAYDTLNTQLFCEKLKIYGFDELTCKWFQSFLTGRNQSVKIGRTISKPKNLNSGVPQGGILSPIIFTIYGADMEEWTKHSTIFNYTDDTSSSCNDVDIKVVMTKLEEDAEEILKFMASNGLVANPTKTNFIVLNNKEKEPLKLKVGKCEIEQERKAKLLGIEIDDDQGWTSHVYGKGGLLASLNQRLFMIKRMTNHVKRSKLKKIVDSIWTSKLRYGLQLFAEVRTREDQPKKRQMTDLQKAQNRMLRVLENKRIADRISVKNMLENQKMLSVNQTSAQIKLNEMWKVKYQKNYPIKVHAQQTAENGRETRGNRIGKLIETGMSRITKASFVGDATRIWNKAPKSITEAKTVYMAKKAIKSYCRTLPI
jgi:hypothetical protein